MTSMIGDHTSMAEAVGEANPRPMTFFPGEHFDPSDPEEMELVIEASRLDGMSIDKQTIARLEQENMVLRSQLGIDS